MTAKSIRNKFMEIHPTISCLVSWLYVVIGSKIIFNAYCFVESSHSHANYCCLLSILLLGPDICGPGTKKVHVIFTYKGKNLLTKKDIRCKVKI